MRKAENSEKKKFRWGGNSAIFPFNTVAPVPLFFFINIKLIIDFLIYTI